MAEFTDEQKTEIVQLLAQFVTPAAVVAQLRAEGIETDRRQIGSYDPTRPYFEAGEKWRVIFWAARKQYIEELEIIPTANKACRVNMLHEAAMEARSKKNYALMAAMLKQIAEDTGGALTNQREVLLDDRGSLTPDERRAAAARLIDRAAGRDETRRATAPASATMQ